MAWRTLQNRAAENRIVSIMIERAGRKLRFRGGLVLSVIALLAGTSYTQTSAPPPGTVQPPVGNPAAGSPLAFEVTTVKLNKSGGSGSHSTFDNGRFTGSNILLKNLIQYQAYGIPEPRILGGPKWLGTERFDIEAKADSSVADQLRALNRDQRRVQIQRMFQQLLADRFKLTVHWETQELPVYALVVAKNGPSLPVSKEAGDSVSTSNGRFVARGVTLMEVAQALTQELSKELGRVVIDKTGMDGRYDVTLKWTPEIGTASVDSGAGDSATPPDSGPSIFTAIQEQLGLKLESTKGSVQVLVIDHIEMPSEN
jgi:uncharacterized protein (TIGR03435 family)